MGLCLKILSGLLIIVTIVSCEEVEQSGYYDENMYIEQEEDRHIETFGQVKAETTRNITLNFPVEIEKIHIKAGERISAGDSLLTLSLTKLESAINSMECELLGAEMEIKKLRLENYNPQSSLFQVKEKKRENIAYELEQLMNQKIKKNIIGNELICTIENGIVSYIGYCEGDFVPGNKLLLSIIDADSIIVKADVPEEFVKDIRIGNRVVITPPADRGRMYAGEVIRISNLATERNGTITVTVEMRVNDRDDFLLPNFNVDVKIFIGE